MIRVLVLVACFVPGVARADAIMGPPEDCPRGSRGESSHTDSICSPSTCVVDGDCGGGTGTEALVCAPNVGLCIESRTRMPGGLRPLGVEAVPVTYDVASTSCSTDADCAAGTHCVVASRCAQRTATEFVRHTLGCTARRGRVSVAAILTGLLLALGLRRRRSPQVVHRRRPRRERNVEASPVAHECSALASPGAASCEGTKAARVHERGGALLASASPTQRHEALAARPGALDSP